MNMTLTNRQSPTRAKQAQDSKADFQTAFESLFQQNWGSLCRVLYRLVGDWDEAEDLALETFVRLYHRPPAEEQNLGGWLYRVGTNLGLNALRSRKRRQHYEEQAGAHVFSDAQSSNPEAEVERLLERQQVRAALAAMKPRLAQVLVLRHAGMSYAEIADAAGIAHGSVGTLLGRAETEFEKKYRQMQKKAVRLEREGG
ncbi:MAG: sigma-70 family RNA polymerase sigma factor [Chloroflexota bacterium]